MIQHAGEDYVFARPENVICGMTERNREMYKERERERMCANDVPTIVSGILFNFLFYGYDMSLVPR